MAKKKKKFVPLTVAQVQKKNMPAIMRIKYDTTPTVKTQKNRSSWGDITATNKAMKEQQTYYDDPKKVVNPVSNSNFKSFSGTKTDGGSRRTADWEKAMLKSVPNGGKYGRSYSDRLSAYLRYDQGMDKKEVSNFRRYQDAVEAENKLKAEQTKIDDGTKKGRKTDLYKKYQNNPTLTAASQANKEIQAENKAGIVKKEDNKKLEAYKKKLTDNKKARDIQKDDRDGILGMLDRTLGRVSNTAMNTFSKEFNKTNQEIMRKSAEATGNDEALQMQKTSTRKPATKEERAADIVGSVFGEASPYFVGPYGVASKALKGVQATSKLGKLAKIGAEGAIAGGIVGGSKAGFRQATDDDETALDSAKLVGREAAWGVGGDIAGTLAVKGIAKAVAKVKQTIKGGGNAERAIVEAAEESGVPVEEVAKEVQLLLNAPQKQLAAPPPPKTVKERLADDPWFAFAQQEKNVPKARFNTTMIDPAEEAIKKQGSEYYVDLYEQVAKVTNNPKEGSALFSSQAKEADEGIQQIIADLASKEDEHVQEVVSSINHKTFKGNELDKFRGKDLDEADMLELTARADVSQSKIDVPIEHVQQHPAFIKQSQKLVQYAEAEAKFQANKELIQQGKNIRDMHGKIVVPAGNKEDYWNEVPQYFRAAVKDANLFDDLDAVAASYDMGVDEFVDYLKAIDVARQTTKKSMTPEGMETAKQVKAEHKALQDIEEAIRTEYRAINEPTIKEAETELDEITELMRNPMHRTDKLAELEETARQDFRASDYSESQLKVIAAHLEEKSILEKPTPEMVYQSLKTEKDPQKLDDLMNIYGKVMDDEPRELMRSLKSDPKIAKALEAFQPKKVKPKPSKPKTPTIPKEMIDEPLKFKKTITKKLRDEEAKLTAKAPTKEEPIEELTEKAIDDLVSGTGSPLDSVYGRKIVPDDLGGVDYNSAISKSFGKKNNGLPKGTQLWVKYSKYLSDKRVAAKMIEKKLTGKRMFSEEGEFGKALDLTSGANGAAVRKLEEELLPVFTKLREAKGSPSNALSYKLALHMQENLKKNPNYILPDGMTADTIKESIKNGATPANIAFAKDMTKFFKEMREELVTSGRISRKAANEMEKLYPNYFPKYRVKDFDDPEAFEQAFHQSFRGPTAKTPIHRVENGSTDIIADPITNIVMQAQKTYQSAANNKALQHLDSLLAFDKKGEFIRTKGGGGATNPVTVYFKGEPTTYYLSKDLYEAVDMAAPDEKMWAIKAVAAVSKLQRNSITLNTAFVIKNAMKDIPQGYQNSRNGMSLIRDVPLAALDLFTNGKALKGLKMQSYMDDFYKNGAGLGNVWSQDNNQFTAFQQKAMKELTKGYSDVSPTGGSKMIQGLMGMMQKYRHYILEPVDNIPKMAEYRAAKRNGKSDVDAAADSRDMLDFTKTGLLVEKLNPFVGFLNVTLQGRSKFYRRPLEIISSDSNATKKTVELGAWVGKAGMIGAFPSLAAYWTVQHLATPEQRKTIEESPIYVRDVFWLFPSPNGEDVIRVPKSFEDGAFISNPIEHFLRNPDLPDETGEAVNKWMWDNLLFDPSLNVVVPFVEMGLSEQIGANSNNFPTIPNRLQKVPKPAQKDIYTSNTAETVAEGFEKIGMKNSALASPMRIDNLIDGLFPVTGKAAVDSIDKNFLGKKEEVPAETYQNQFTKPLAQFRTKGASATSSLVSSSYNAHSRMQGYKQSKDDRFNEPKYKKLNALIKGMNDTSGEIRGVAEGNKSPQAKRDAINELIQERNELARKANRDGILTK